MKFWIARDKDGELCLYKTKPWKRENTDYHNDEFDCDDYFMDIDKDLFPEVTFENSPQEVELKLKNKNMEKINVAELLKDCPKGMELDCTMYKKCTLIEVDNSNLYPIRLRIQDDLILRLSKYGANSQSELAKCVIFPKGKSTWEGFIPPCTFKKGDVLISQAGNMVLFSHIDSKNVVHYHCILKPGEGFRIEENTSVGVGEYSDCILANGHQKQRMYDKIKSAGYKYNQDTNKLEKLPEFKDGDVCYIKTNCDEHIFIFNCIDKYGVKRYANLTKHGFYTDTVNVVCSEGFIEEFRYATEEEKDRLFKSIKDHGYMWNPEKKCLEKLPKFKNGDILAAGDWVFIFKELHTNGSPRCYCHYDLTLEEFKVDTNSYMACGGDIYLATKEQQDLLFSKMEGAGYKWNAETKTLEKIIKPKFKVGDRIKHVVGREEVATVVGVEETHYNLDSKVGTSSFTISLQREWELVPDKFDTNTLIPYESKVLVRAMINDTWKPAIFGCITKKSSCPFVTLGGVSWAQCIPFEGNEHLFNKTDDCDSYFKTWED